MRFTLNLQEITSNTHPGPDAIRQLWNKAIVEIQLIKLQYIPRNMHTVTALLCFVVDIHWLIFPYPSGLLHWHCGNLTIAPVPAKQPWWIWINTSCEFIINDCITTTKQSTTKPCAYFLGYTVGSCWHGKVPTCFFTSRIKRHYNPLQHHIWSAILCDEWWLENDYSISNRNITAITS